MGGSKLVFLITVSLLVSVHSQGSQLSQNALKTRDCVVNQGQSDETAVFCSHRDAITRLHQDIFGDDETYDTWSVAQVPPTSMDDQEQLQPVTVAIQVFVEKIKIDSREQEATLKFWLRSTWDDQRLSWRMADYAYRVGPTAVGYVDKISRSAGFWKPDLVLYEAHEHFQSTAFANSDFPAEIQPNGNVYLAQAQQVVVHFAPEMNMHSFPFDEEIIQFSIGPWTHTADQVNMVFFDTGFIRLPGFDCFFRVPEANADDPGQWGPPAPCNVDESLEFSEANSTSIDQRKFAFSEEWDLTGYNQLKVLKTYFDTNNNQAFTEMQGRIYVRRFSAFYMNFIIIPNIFITMIGFAAHSFRGHTAGSVTFIAGTGFTVALALVAQNLFLVEVIPVITSYSFLEFVFVYSFGLSLIATTTSLYLYKQTEGREENENWVSVENRTWVTMSDDERRMMKITLCLEVSIFPSFGLAYTVGVCGTAAGFGAYSGEIGGMLLYLIIGFVILCLAAFLDCWRSADMKYAPNRPLKRHLRLYLRGSRLYQKLWYTTADHKAMERNQYLKDADITRLNEELQELMWDVSARIEKKIFFRNDERDMKEEERARLMAEIDRMQRLLDQHGLVRSDSGRITSPSNTIPQGASGQWQGAVAHARMSVGNGEMAAGSQGAGAVVAPAPPGEPVVMAGVTHADLAQVQIAGQQFGGAGATWLAEGGVGASTAARRQGAVRSRKTIEELLAEWELEDAEEALRAFGVTTEQRFRRLLREEHVAELGLPPVTQLAVLELMQHLRSSD